MAFQRHLSTHALSPPADAVAASEHSSAPCASWLSWRLLTTGLFLLLTVVLGHTTPVRAADLVSELTLVAPLPSPATSASVVSSQLVIEGTAAGDDFRSAILDYGEGEFPTEWKPIAKLVVPVTQGSLGQWETKAIPAGRLTVRLTVYSADGLFRRTQRLVDLREWRPDLVIRQLISQSKAGKLTVAVDVANRGRQPAPAGIDLTLGVVADRQAEPASMVRLVRWQIATSLTSNQQASKTGTVELPPTLKPGRYYLMAVVDHDGQIVDADRSDNHMISERPVDLSADLVMTKLNAELSADGASLRVTDLVQNDGMLPTQASSSVVYFLSADGTIDQSDSILGRRSVPPLKPGMRSTKQVTVLLPAALDSGRYYLLGRVNAPGADGRRVAEVATENNDYWGSRVSLGPDLVMTSVDVRIDPVERELVVTGVVTNRGRYGATGPIALRYHLVEEGGISRTAPVIGERTISGPLSPGKALRSMLHLALPEELQSGRYEVVGRLDPEGHIDDTNRGNNERASRTLAIGLDLAVSDIRVAPSSEGRTAQVNATVTNRGLLSAHGAVTFKVVTEIDDDPGSRQVVGETTVGGGLAPGQSIEMTLGVFLPEGMERQRARLFVQATPSTRETDVQPENNLIEAGTILSPGIDVTVHTVRTTRSERGRDELLSVNATVENQGRQATTKPFEVTYLLSPQLSGGAPAKTIVLGTKRVPSLAAGATQSLKAQLKIPPDVSTQSYLLRVVADREGVLGELKRDNNEASGGSLTVGPDLAWGALAAKLIPSTGELEITDEVTNQSRYAVEQPIAVVYRLIAEGGVVRLAPEVGHRTIKTGIKGGGTVRQTTRWPLPEGIGEGRFQVLGQVDSQQQIIDRHRDNNTMLSDWLLIGYDLAVTQVTAEPLASGEQITVSDTVENQGWLSSPTGATVRYYLADGALPKALSGQPIGQRSINVSLSPGETSSESVTLRLPDGAAHRRWRVIAKVGSDGTDVQASNDINMTGQWINDGVDLAVGQTSVEMASGGDRIKITDTIRNFGRQPLSKAVRIRYALSVSGGSEEEAIVLGDRTINTIAAGGSSKATTSWPLPSTLEPSRYFVVIQIDPDRRLEELKRDNNVAAGSSVRIGPDPMIEVIDATLAPEGAAMAITVTLVNRGNRSMSGPVPVMFSIAKDETGQVPVMGLGRKAVEPLTPGSRTSLAYTFRLPESLAPGVYYVTARLDVDRQPTDADGAGEVTVTQTALALGPDLSTSTLQAELVGHREGLSVSITDTIVNQGNRNVSGPFKVSYVLSTDWRLDRNDVLLGQRTIETLPPAEQNSATVRFPVPVVTIETGRYFLLSRIDLENVVAESDRSNNLHPTIEGLLIEKLEKKRKPDMPDVISGQ